MVYSPRMSKLHGLQALATSIEGGWGENAHRTITDTGRRFFCLADGSGPTYGGYHAPIAIDHGLATLVAALDTATPDVHDPLEAALKAAHQQMRALGSASDDVFKRISRKVKRPLDAALLAADEVRPADLEERCGRVLVHFAAQVTACLFRAPDALLVGQVGNSRAYRLRDGTLDLLLTDHSVETMMIAQGTSPDEARIHRAAIQSCLGVGDPRIDTARLTFQAGDRYLLCCQSIWAGDDSARHIDDLMKATTQQQLDDMVASITEHGPGDTSALLIQVER